MNLNIRPTSSRLLRLRNVLLLAGVALAPIACGSSSSPTAPSVNVPYSQTDLVVGTGTEATGGKRVAVNYTGWLYDASKPESKGQQFDTSIGRGAYTFTLGAAQVIKGWDQGVVGMRVGGTRRLVIPPSLAYGATGNGPIPGNATLIFDVALLDVQ